MAITSSTTRKAFSTIAHQGTFNPAAAKAIPGGSISPLGTATTVILLGKAAQTKPPATYTAQALLKDAGINLTDDQKKKLADGSRATEQLARVTKLVKSDRKAAAAEKIKQIKERLKQLALSGGDPKQVARQAARLARELKEAVREYGAASAGAAQVADISNENAPQVDGGGEAGEVGSAAVGETVAAENVAGVAAPEVKSPPPTDASIHNASTRDPAAGEKSDTVPEGDEIAAGRAGKPDQDRAKALIDQVAKADAEAQEADAERRFLEDIKTLAKQIKALFERKKAEAERNKGADVDLALDGKAVKDAVKAIEDVVRDLGEALQGKVTGIAAGQDPALPLGGGAAAAAPIGTLLSVLA